MISSAIARRSTYAAEQTLEAVTEHSYSVRAATDVSFCAVTMMHFGRRPLRRRHLALEHLPVELTPRSSRQDFAAASAILPCVVHAMMFAWMYSSNSCRLRDDRRS